MADGKDFVNVQDESGNIVNVDRETAANVPGLTPLTPEQQAGLDAKEKYGTLSQKLITGAEGAASGLTFGASRYGENLLGLSSPEEQELRRQINPLSSMAGEFAGMGGLLIGTGGMGGVGEAGAEAVGLGAEAAASRAATNAAKVAEEMGLSAKEAAASVSAARNAELAKASLAGRLGSKSLSTAIENAVYAGGSELTKKVFDDPNQTASSALANGLESFVLGGAFGLVHGGLREVWIPKYGSKIEKGLQDLKTEADAATPSSAPGIPSSDPLSGGVAEYKPNAEEIKQASNELGFEPTQGMVDKESWRGHYENELAKSKTPFGRAMNSRLEAADESMANASKSTLSDASEMSPNKSGEAAQESIVKVVKDELEPISKGFENERVHMQNMDLTKDAKAEAVSSIVTHGSIANPTSLTEDAGKKLSSIAKDIWGLKSVDDVKQFRTQLNNEIQKAVLSGDHNLLDGLNTAKTALKALEERGINESSLALAGREGNQIAADTIGRIKALRSGYAVYKQKLSDLGEALGLGKVKNVGQLEDKLGDLRRSSSNLPYKIFDAGNLKRLEFFKQNFPEAFETSRKAILKDIFDASIDNSRGSSNKFSVQKFITQVRKIEPEAREMLFPGQGRTLRNIAIANANFPGSFNTSNTAAALGFFDNIHGSAWDAVKLGILKAADHLERIGRNSGESEASKIASLRAASSQAKPDGNAFKTMLDYISSSARGDNSIGKGIKAIFSGGSLMPALSIESANKKKESLDKLALKLQEDPSALMNVGGNLGHYLPEHQMEVAKMSSQAINYINSIRPSLIKMGPLDKDIEPSKVEKESFDNALSMAVNPTLILGKVKNGTISGDDMKHFQGLYPDLLENMRGKVMNEITNQVSSGVDIPYQTKMGLSLFLGQALDSTMTPQGIMAAQPQGVVNPSQQIENNMQSQAKGPHSMKNIGKLATSEATPGQSRAHARQIQN